MGSLPPSEGSQDHGGAGSVDPRSRGPALELRVHGVHGTSPASMLGVKDPRQVAGDGVTGVFRADGEGGLPRRRLVDGTAVEAYSWGALTSAVRGALGWVQRVLWLGLLPFALINLAYWARLHVGTADTRDGTVEQAAEQVVLDGRRARWGAAAVRWAALLLTLLFVLTACLVSLDLVGWQCYRGGTKSCDVLPGWLDFMMLLAPSRRLAVAAVVPLAGTALLWFLSRRTLTRYEECRVGAPAEGRHLLQDERFWSSTERTRRLQRIHLAAAVALVVTYVGAQVEHLAGRLGLGTVVGTGVLLTCFAALTRAHEQDLEHDEDAPDEGGDQGRDGSAPSRSLADGESARWLLRVAMVAMALQLAWLVLPGTARDSEGWVGSGGWFGHNLWFIGVVVALSGINIAVFVAGRLSFERSVLAIVAFCLVTAAAAALSLWNEEGRTRGTVLLILGAVGVAAATAFVLMLRWQLGQRSEHPSEAWNGGGAAMLVGAAGWIALLFTTAAVTASADYLNGPDQSVSDLASFQEAVTRSAAPDRVADRSASLPVRVSEGAVLRDGIILMGPEPRIIRGDLVVESAEVDDPDVGRPLPDTVLVDATLALEDSSLLLVDTCRVSPGQPVPPACHPDTAGFAPAVRVAVTGKALDVSDGGRVRLRVEDPPTTPLVVPQVLIWAPVVQVAWVVLVAVVAACCLGRLRRRVRPQVERLLRREKVPRESQVDVLERRVRAAYAHRAERLLELVGGVTVASVLALLCLSATGLPPGTLVSTLLPGWRSDLPHLLASLSLYVVLGLSAGLVLLSSYVRRSEATRKAVGILWDLTTFWPRAAHPLSPPCYAERVVPELTARISWGLRRGGIVVVSGHSQGSLIAAATLIRMEPTDLDRVRFVTYGSQLRALYGRIFPAVLGPRVLGCVPTDGTPTFGQAFPDVPPDAPDAGAEVGVAESSESCPTLAQLLGEGDWVNLFRRGDPLGWRVFSDFDSDRDVCTREVPLRVAGDPGPIVATHSGYQHSREYREVVGGWLGETVVDETAWAIGEVEPLPEP